MPRGKERVATTGAEDFTCKAGTRAMPVEVGVKRPTVVIGGIDLALASDLDASVASGQLPLNTRPCSVVKRTRAGYTEVATPSSGFHCPTAS